MRRKKKARRKAKPVVKYEEEEEPEYEEPEEPSARFKRRRKMLLKRKKKPRLSKAGNDHSPRQRHEHAHNRPTGANDGGAIATAACRDLCQGLPPGRRAARHADLFGLRFFVAIRANCTKYVTFAARQADAANARIKR